MRTIILVLFLIVYLTVGMLGLLFQIIYGKLVDSYKADMMSLRYVQWALKVVMFICGVKLEVYGHENVPKDEPVLYIGNHRGFFDIVSTYSLVPGRTGYISKDTLDLIPGLHLYMRRLYCLFLDRKDIKSGLKIVLKAIERIKSGISICIFPEGTRSKNIEHPEELGKFKEGSFKIATKTNCKIIPMAILGSDDIFENSFPWIKKGTIKIKYGQPIILDELDEESKKKIGAYTRERIIELIKEL